MPRSKLNGLVALTLIALAGCARSEKVDGSKLRPNQANSESEKSNSTNDEPDPVEKCSLEC